MRRTLHSTCLALGVCALLCLAGCGGGDVAVQISGVPDGSITTAQVGHWMQALVGSDFREAVGVEGPHGLVSEPADYPRCVAAAKLVSARSFFNQLRPSRPKLTKECRDLHEAAKAQALDFLISARWAIAEAAKHGIVVTGADVARAFAAARSRLYPTEQGLRSYLVERQWSLADLLYRLKLETLAGRLRPREGPGTASGDGTQVTVADLLTHHQSLAAATHCRSGYVVPGCSGYRGGQSETATPDSLLEKLAWKRP